MNKKPSLINLRRMFACSALLVTLTSFADPIVIDTFTNPFSAWLRGPYNGGPGTTFTGSPTTISHPSGTITSAWGGLVTGGSILGGTMQMWVYNGYAFNAASATIDTNAGDVSVYGTQSGGASAILQYGTAIAPAEYTSNMLYHGSPIDLGLNLQTTDSLQIDFSQFAAGMTSVSFNYDFYTGSGQIAGGINAPATAPGSFAYTLGALGLDSVAASDIQGMSLTVTGWGANASQGTIIDGLQFDTSATVPEDASIGLIPCVLGGVILLQGLIRRRR